MVGKAWGLAGAAAPVGRYDPRMADSMTAQRILLVCTGNTCRSPMAEVIARDLLAGQPGVSVSSAGVFAGEGAPASAEAVEAMAAEGLDLSGHRSQPLTAQLVEEADVIFTMTEAHRQAVLSAVPDADGKTQRLDPQQDVADPIGGPLSEYQQAAAMIRRALQQRFMETPA